MIQDYKVHPTVNPRERMLSSSKLSDIYSTRPDPASSHRPHQPEAFIYTVIYTRIYCMRRTLCSLLDHWLLNKYKLQLSCIFIHPVCLFCFCFVLVWKEKLHAEIKLFLCQKSMLVWTGLKVTSSVLEEMSTTLDGTSLSLYQFLCFENFYFIPKDNSFYSTS